MACLESLRNQKHTHTYTHGFGTSPSLQNYKRLLGIPVSFNPPSVLLVSSGHSLNVLAATVWPLGFVLFLPVSPGSFLATPPCIFQVLSLTCYRCTSVHICLQDADSPMSSPTYPSLLRTLIHPSNPPLRISFQEVFPSIQSPGFLWYPI